MPPTTPQPNKAAPQPASTGGYRGTNAGGRPGGFGGPGGAARRPFGGGNRGGGSRGPGGPGGDAGRGGPRRGGRRDKGDEKVSEFGSKTIDVRRVTRVVAGGRRFNFSVAIVLGDKKGRVGVGLGKAGDVALAIDKATRDAKKNMIRVTTTETNSIPHQVDSKFCSSKILLIPAPGRGLVAGSSVRNVLDLAGVTDVTGKVLSRSKNKLNNARAAIEALKTLHPYTKKVVAKAEPKVAPETVIAPEAPVAPGAVK